MYIHTQNGNQTNAIGIASHSEGNITRASGNYSHSEGNSTQSGGIASHSEGQHTLASSEAQHVQGKYNIEDNNGTYAHIVGNGTSNNNRSNAHTLDWNGNAWYAGDIRIGGKDYSTALSLRTKIQELRDNSIKGTSTGTTVTLTDSYPTPLLDYKIYGNSVQETSSSPIYSVGDLVSSGEHQGEYEIPIRMSGKNKFDYESASNINNTIVSSYRLFEISGLKPNTQYNINNLSFTQALSNIYTYLWDIPSYADSTKYMITQPSYYYNKVGFYSSSSGKIYLGIYPSDENTWNTIIQYFTNAQIEEGSVQTSYEPYMPVISQIYLDEPLRKIGTSVDYIDFKNSKVIRNVEAIDETGTLPISNGLQPLIPPTEETITLPDIIPISINGNMITGTNITGTLDITYIKDTNKVINNLESRITLLE